MLPLSYLWSPFLNTQIDISKNAIVNSIKPRKCQILNSCRSCTGIPVMKAAGIAVKMIILAIP